jgi:hypothetical protein
MGRQGTRRAGSLAINRGLLYPDAHGGVMRRPRCPHVSRPRSDPSLVLGRILCSTHICDRYAPVGLRRFEPVVRRSLDHALVKSRAIPGVLTLLQRRGTAS